MEMNMAETLKLVSKSLDEIEFKEMTVVELLSEREKTHGKYRDVAALSQALKDVMRSSKNWHRLTDGQREALEMDASKTARILSGDADFRDHWDDKAGYSKLGSESSGLSLSTVKMDLENASR